MDVVFVPDTTFQGNLNLFIDNAHEHVRNGFFRLSQSTIDPIPGGYWDRFNFYYYTGGFGSVNLSDVCEFSLPGVPEHNKWVALCSSLCASLWPFGCLACMGEPHTYNDDALFSDVAGIIYNQTGGGCADALGPRSSFAAGTQTNVVMHESGHALFALEDEYCGTSYTQVDDYPNVWGSLQNCQNDPSIPGWSMGGCARICTADAWHYDPASWVDTSVTSSITYHDFMLACGPGCSTSTHYMFFEADTRRINYVINQFPATGVLMENLSNGSGEGLLMYLNLNQGKFTPYYSKLVKGYPNIGLQEGPFLVEVLSKSGEILYSFKLWDPRIRIGSQGGVGKVFTDNVNFSIAFPYPAEAKTVQIKDKKTHDLLLTVDIAESMKYWRYVFLPITTK